MSTMNSELYRALVSAGATDDMATKAAESVASYDKTLAEVKTELVILRWMVGTVAVGVLALLAKAYLPG